MTPNNFTQRVFENLKGVKQVNGTHTPIMANLGLDRGVHFGLGIEECAEPVLHQPLKLPGGQAKAAWAGVAVMDSNRWVNRTACKPPLQIAMRKAILMTLLAVVSSSAAAGWIEAVSDERSTIY